MRTVGAFLFLLTWAFWNAASLPEGNSQAGIREMILINGRMKPKKNVLTRGEANELNEYQALDSRYFSALQRHGQEAGSWQSSWLKEQKRTSKRAGAKGTIPRGNNATRNLTSPEDIGHRRFPKNFQFGKNKSIIELILRNAGEGKRKSKYDPALKFMGLGKRYVIDDASLKLVHFGETSLRSNPVTDLTSSDKRGSNYDPAFKYMGLGKRFPQAAVKSENTGYHDEGSKFPASEKGDLASDFKIKNFDKRGVNFALALKPTYLRSQDFSSDGNGLASEKGYRKFSYGKRLKNHRSFDTLYDPALKYMGLGKREENNVFNDAKIASYPFKDPASITRAKRSFASDNIYVNATNYQNGVADMSYIAHPNVKKDTTLLPTDVTERKNTDPLKTNTIKRYYSLKNKRLHVGYEDNRKHNVLKKIHSICTKVQNSINVATTFRNKTETKGYSPTEMLTIYDPQAFQHPLFPNFNSKQRINGGMLNFESGGDILGNVKRFPMKLCSKIISYGDHYGSFNVPVYGMVANEIPSPDPREQLYLTMATPMNAPPQGNEVQSTVAVKIVLEKPPQPFQAQIFASNPSHNEQ